MTEPLCQRLGEASLEVVALAIQNYAEGDPPDVGGAKAAINEMFELLLEVQVAISRLEAGTLTRADARSMCVLEPCPKTRPEGT